MTKESNPPTQWHQLSFEDVLSQLSSSPAGMSAAEVAKRQKEAGPNPVRSVRGTPAWLKFVRQFHQPLVYIMLVAVGVTSSLGEWMDAAVIGAIVLVNALVGFLQETKAESAIEALAKMVVTEVTVRREGNKQRVPSESLIVVEIEKKARSYQTNHPAAS